MNTETQRRMFAPLVRGLLVCLLGSYAFTAIAGITEVEPNDSLSTAQSTPVPATGITISAMIGRTAGDLTTDVDFFTFDATQGDTPSITIVGAMGPADAAGNCSGFPSNLALYDSLGNMLGGGQETCGLADAMINNVTLSSTGKYFVAVSAWSHYFDPDGVVENMDMATPGGPYQLVINNVRNPTPTPPPPPPPVQSPSAKHVPIEVRHWHQDERDLDNKRRGMWPIAVAILSMSDFDAMTVDPNSLTFGATGNEKSLFRCRKQGRDINRDGLIDMVCYFKADVANFQTGHLNGVLKGKTKSGQVIEGSAALKIFSRRTERHGFKHRDHDGDKRP
ncbi:MAG: PPC domain-containing protein [Betaproteobacteria bacterium]|nr:PPC domain-containing protein [Betaproteobacteria bacterium]